MAGKGNINEAGLQSLDHLLPGNICEIVYCDDSKLFYLTFVSFGDILFHVRVLVQSHEVVLFEDLERYIYLFTVGTTFTYVKK